MTTETIPLARHEGTRFALTVYPAAAPAAPVLLIQPAMGVQAGYYDKLAMALRDNGCHVVVSELRGHEAEGGRRPGRSYDFSYHEMMAEDWPQAIAAVKARFAGAPLYLLGHSLGGQVSALYAANHPGSVDGLILIACCSIHWKLWGSAFLAYSQAATLTARLLGHFPGKVFRFAGREARGVIADWARQARTGDFRTGRHRVNHKDALAAMTLPVLAISLQGDFFAPKHAMDDLLAKFSGVKLSRHHLDPKAMGIEGIDHFRWARKPETVVPTVLEWLEAQRPS
jgi:predicted alpha/beta hydrolase